MPKLTIDVPEGFEDAVKALEETLERAQAGAPAALATCPVAHASPSPEPVAGPTPVPTSTAQDDVWASPMTGSEGELDGLPSWAAASSVLAPRPLDPDARAAVREAGLRGPRAAAAAAASVEPPWYGESNRAAERRLAAIEELVRLYPECTEEQMLQQTARVEADELDISVYTGWVRAVAARRR